MAVEIRAATYAALRTALAAGTYQVGQMVFCEGRAAAADGGQGTFQVQAIGALADDGGVTLTGGSLAAVRIESEVSVCAFGAFGDGSTDDTSAIQGALNSVSLDKTLVFPKKTFVANGAIVCTRGVSVRLDGPTFNLGDTGAAATTVTGATGKVGLHFKEADGVRISGEASFVGQGTPGTTSLLGVLFDHCDNADVPATFRFADMAIGKAVYGCARGRFGDSFGDNIYGLQTFESPPTNNAGSVENVAGCTDCSFGDVAGVDIEKPARYMSVASSLPDNERCVFGKTVSVGRSGSLTAHALALRSAVDCAFGAVVSQNAGRAVSIQQYSGDGDWHVDRVHIDSVTGSGAGTSASSDAFIYVSTDGPNALGRVSIGNIDCQTAGEFGFYQTAGALSIDRIRLTGTATRLMVLAGDGSARFKAGKVEIGNNTGSSSSPVSIGLGVKVDIESIDFFTGPGSSATGALRYDSSFGSGSLLPVSIGRIRYDKNGSAGDYTWVMYDLTNECDLWSIGHIQGTGTTAQARFTTVSCSINNGLVIRPSAPGSGAFPVGRRIGNSAAAGSGSPGWVYTAGGWKTEAALGA